MSATSTDRGHHVRRSASQWDEIFERFTTSGLTQRAFCEREGLAYSSFTCWRAKRAEKAPRSKAAVGAASTFVPLTPVACNEPADKRRPSHITLELGRGISLHIELD